MEERTFQGGWGRATRAPSLSFWVAILFGWLGTSAASPQLQPLVVGVDGDRLAPKTVGDRTKSCLGQSHGCMQLIADSFVTPLLSPLRGFDFLGSRILRAYAAQLNAAATSWLVNGRVLAGKRTGTAIVMDEHG